MNKALLRNIPQVEMLLQMLGEETAPRQVQTEAARAVLAALRADILAGRTEELPGVEELCARVSSAARLLLQPSLRRVVNATGIVLHTNLGRAPLSAAAAKAVGEVALGYSTLEYDLKTGERGSRHEYVSALLRELTGAEDAFAVNNNAAAVLLTLSALAEGGEVVISRGELVEIGGSFRVPEIMESCGAVLKEVGTTNRTYIEDYAAAISEKTKVLLKVHTSNFSIIGFTSVPEREELTKLAGEKGLYAVEDLGSGAMIEPEVLGFHTEPSVFKSVSSGMDVVTFSGDKLMGGPQAGILAGKKEVIARLKRHPLARAMRLDKMTLAALEATLTAYRNGTARKEIPVLRMLTAEPAVMYAAAARLSEQLNALGYETEVTDSEDMTGGGSVPAQTLQGYAVSLKRNGISADALEEKLRLASVPVIGRIRNNAVLLHTRTLLDGDEERVHAAAREVLL